MARNRMSTKDWDPMRDNYNNSSQNGHYQDEDTNGGVEMSHTKLYVTNIAVGLSEDGLRMAFSKFGNIVHLFLSRDVKKRFAIVGFKSDR
ncbi:unnamed protein product [Leptidea sinapis]|uniref:RRM domain-containing protein n=1 Tax=Leptidea sinapis TaxID=189913 RepID=A0A5E4QM04_9NEOP|nr:unnamed protein product [Leptidea sinapis]